MAVSYTQPFHAVPLESARQSTLNQKRNAFPFAAKSPGRRHVDVGFFARLPVGHAVGYKANKTGRGCHAPMAHRRLTKNMANGGLRFLLQAVHHAHQHHSSTYKYIANASQLHQPSHHKHTITASQVHHNNSSLRIRTTPAICIKLPPPLSAGGFASYSQS